MAALPSTTAGIELVEVESFVRGYHAYRDKWTPVRGETLQLNREPHNSADNFAVAVINKEDAVVGHVPFNLAPIFSYFLQRDFNKASLEITGDRINRGAGYGLEVPCVYRLYGPKAYVDKIRVIVRSEVSKYTIP